MSQSASSPGASSDQGASLLQLAPMVAIVFFGFLAIGMPLPVLPRQVHEALGFGPVVVGWVVGLQSLVTVLTRPLGGMVVDARGPKIGALLGLPCAIAAGAAYLGSSFLSAPAASLGVLLVGRVLLGFAESLFLTGTMTWGMSRVGMKNAGRVMAWQGIAMYAALGFGAPIGLAIQQAAGFRTVAAVVIGLPAVGLLIALATPAAPRSSRPPQGGSMVKVLSAVWPQGLALALGTAPYAAMAAFLALHFAARHWGGAGLALLAFASGYIGVRVFFGHLPDRMGGSQVAVASLLVEAVGQVVLWSAPSQAVAILGCLVSGLGFSLVFPSFGVQAVRKTSPEVRGLAVSAFMAFFDVALGLTGPAVGLVAGRFGYGAVFLVGAVSAALAALVGLVGSGRKAA